MYRPMPCSLSSVTGPSWRQVRTWRCPWITSGASTTWHRPRRYSRPSTPRDGALLRHVPVAYRTQINDAVADGAGEVVRVLDRQGRRCSFTSRGTGARSCSRTSTSRARWAGSPACSRCGSSSGRTRGRGRPCGRSRSSCGGCRGGASATACCATSPDEELRRRLMAGHGAGELQLSRPVRPAVPEAGRSPWRRSRPVLRQPARPSSPRPRRAAEDQAGGRLLGTWTFSR